MKIVKKKYDTENIEYQHLKAINDETVLQYNKIVSKVAITNKKVVLGSYKIISTTSVPMTFVKSRAQMVCSGFEPRTAQ